MHYAQAGKIQGHAVGAQRQEAAVGGVAQGVRQSPRLISGAAAKEGNSEFPRKTFLPGGFMCPSPMCLLTSHIDRSSLRFQEFTGGFLPLPIIMSVLFGFHNQNIDYYISSWGIFLSQL